MIDRNWVAVTVVLVALLASPVVAGEVCPSGRSRLDHVDLYDGPIADMAQLAPEKSGRNWQIWSLEPNSDEKRPLTVRCSYKDGTTHDVVLADAVKHCRSDEKAGVLGFSCK